MVNMIPVTSSNIRSIGFDSRNHRLFVEFNSGATWTYTGVEKSIYDALMDAGSKGSFFYHNIRDYYNAEEGMDDY